MNKLEDYLVSIPDFPKPGVVFRDITSILQDKYGLQLAIKEILKLLAETSIWSRLRNPADFSWECLSLIR